MIFMKRNYEALFGAFYERYVDFKNEKMSNAEAIACTFDAYYGVQSRGEMEKAVVNIAEGKIHLTHPKIFFKSKERIIEALNYLDLNKLKMEVNLEEYKDILERRDMVLDEIDGVPVDYCPCTRWYYYEMETQVKNYFENVLAITENEIIEKMLEHFERDYTNTSSENIIIKTTLLELIIRHNVKVDEEAFRQLRNELKYFKLDDLEQQLSEFEKIDLSIRIKNLLDKA